MSGAVQPYSLEEIERERLRRAGYKIKGYFPDDGPYRRSLYPKHMAFLGAGLTHRERCFLAANRVGKSELGAYETTCHLTGVYPAWWPGRRFERPVAAWCAGDTSKTVRDILQEKLVGKAGEVGTGMIPAHAIKHLTHKSGLPGAVDTVWIAHLTGGVSTLNLKSYDQRREAFQGTAIDVIWLDEECPQDIYTECLLRTMDTPDRPGGGLIILTFTPLQGITPLVLQFMAPDVDRPPAELGHTVTLADVTAASLPKPMPIERPELLGGPGFTGKRKPGRPRKIDIEATEA